MPSIVGAHVEAKYLESGGYERLGWFGHCDASRGRLEWGSSPACEMGHVMH